MKIQINLTWIYIEYIFRHDVSQSQCDESRMNSWQEKIPYVVSNPVMFPVSTLQRLTSWCRWVPLLGMIKDLFWPGCLGLRSIWWDNFVSIRSCCRYSSPVWSCVTHRTCIQRRCTTETRLDPRPERAKWTFLFIHWFHSSGLQFGFDYYEEIKGELNWKHIKVSVWWKTKS